jgi:hypothetical protein
MIGSEDDDIKIILVIFDYMAMVLNYVDNNDNL